MGSLSLPVPMRVYTRSGQLIAQIGEKRRELVAYDDIPLVVRQAFIAAEDQRFYTHHGFDYSGVLRAIWVDLTSHGYAQGASTITMQAARNMFLTLDKTHRAQAAGDLPDVPHGARIHQGADPPDLSECDLPGPALLRRGRRR